MALSFKKNNLEAVDFGGIVAVPQVDVEARLRLGNLELKNPAGVKEAISVIAGCFGDKAEEVEQFMNESFGVVEIAQLQAYLVGGEKFLERINKKLEED